MAEPLRRPTPGSAMLLHLFEDSRQATNSSGVGDVLEPRPTRLWNAHLHAP